MLKHHHHNGAPLSTSRRRRSHLHQTSSRSVPEVGIIPGNRFFLLPLKKVTALVRPHTPCRELSATRTKPCIVSKPSASNKQLQASRQGAEIHRESLLREFYVRSEAHSKRLRAKQRRRRSLVATTRLSPVCEGTSGVVEQELLLECEGLLWNDRSLVDTRNFRSVGVSNRSRSRDTSIFTFGESTLQESYRGACLAASSTQMLQELNLNTATKRKKKKRSSSFSNVSDIDAILHRSSRRTHTKLRFSGSTSTERECMVPGGRSFKRNNRVSPSSLSHGQQLHPEFGTGNDCTASFSDIQTPWNKNRSNSRRNCTASFSKADELVPELETLWKKNQSKSRDNCTTSFDEADEVVPELETPWNKNRSNSRGNCTTSFDKGDELATLCDKNRSNFRGNSTTSFDGGDELVKLCDKTRSNFRGSSTTSFDRGDELATLCDKTRSNFRGKSTTSFDKGDELVKLCEKNRRKSRGHRRTSFGKAEEILIREKKRRNFSFWRCSHQIRSCSPFLCSFTNKNDLPVGPSPLQLSRRLQNKASVAQGRV